MAKINESELNARYIDASHRFALASDWRTYLKLADEYRALDTYKDAAQMYMKCVKAASAPAYREIKANIAALESAESETGPRAEDYREAARIMLIIQDFQDARETARVYTVKANVMTYNEATAIVTDSQATADDILRAVELFRSIKTFKNCRELIERWERRYNELIYAEATELMQNGHVFSEFDEAAELFARIPTYADAADLCTACKKKANQLRPKHQKREKTAASPAAADETAKAPAADGDAVKLTKEQRKALRAQAKAGNGTTETVRKPRRTADETSNGFVEVWQQLDKRWLLVTLVWLVVFIAALYASIYVAQRAQAEIEANDLNGWFSKHLTALRGGCITVYIVSAIMCVRSFLRMLTKSMRRRLAQSMLAVAKRLVSPVVKAVTRLLASIGIDLTRRNRLSGRDEKTIVYAEDTREKKRKKKLKNELKWVEQTDNAARIRFIFIDYMIRRIKDGYFMRRTMTPAEISRDMTLEEDEKELFRVYTMARYAANAAANSEIDNEKVGLMRAINQRKN